MPPSLKQRRKIVRMIVQIITNFASVQELQKMYDNYEANLEMKEIKIVCNENTNEENIKR